MDQVKLDKLLLLREKIENQMRNQEHTNLWGMFQEVEKEINNLKKKNF